MKISCDSRELAYAVHKCAILATKSRTFNYLSDLKIEVNNEIAKVSATDNYTFLTYYVDIDSTENGEAIVDAKSFAAFISVKAGQLSAHTTDKNLIVKIAGNRVLLNLYNGAFPEFPKSPFERPIEIEGSTLLRLFKVATMAEDDMLVEPMFTGTMLLFGNEYVYSMATNKYKLGYAWSPIDYTGTSKFLVPQQAVNILTQIIEHGEKIKIYNTTNNNRRRLFFISEKFVVSCVELAGNYPHEAVSKMMSATREHGFSVKTDDFVEALKACKVMARASSHLKAKTITIDADFEYKLADVKTAKENEIGEMKLVVPISDLMGSPFIFKLNSDFADTALSAIQQARKESDFFDDRISISLSEKSSFVYLSARGVDSLYTIAPIDRPEIKRDEEKAEVSL